MELVNKNLKTAALILVISITASFAWAMTYQHGKERAGVKAYKPVARKKKEHLYDPVLLRQFELLSAQLDFNKPHCTYSGVINVVDGGDTAAAVHNLEFLFCRSGKDFYYRMGNTETVHDDGINLFIQHKQNKIVLSNSDMSVQSPVTNLGAIEKNLRNEDYDLVESTLGTTKKISVLNDTHITCKELSLTCDTVSGKLQKIYARFSNISDPLNKKKDRVFSISINEMEQDAHLGRYVRLHDVLTGNERNWRLKNKYANYELIQL